MIIISLGIFSYIYSTGYYTSGETSTDMSTLLILAAVLGMPGVIGACANLIFYLKGNKAVLNLDEKGISINLTETDKEAEFIGWDEISKIEKSTDNMNKPAVRITLKGHKNGVYQFYIPCDILGVKQADLMDLLMQYFTPAEQ